MALIAPNALALSPLAKRGLAVFALIIAFLFLDRLLGSLNAARSERNTLETQYSELLSVRDSDDPAPYYDTVRERIETFEKGFLSEETQGLNSAKFQSQLITLLATCGAQGTVVDLDVVPFDAVDDLSLIEADVRTTADLLVLSVCLDSLNNNPVEMHVDAMRWMFPSQVSFRVSAYALDRAAPS